MNVIEGFKEVVSLVQKIDNIDLLQKILGLQGQALQLQQNLVDRDRALDQKDREISELKNKLRFKEKLIKLGDSYYEKDSKGKPIGDPYCTHCFEVNKQGIHLISSTSMHPKTRAYCPLCKNGTMYFIKISLENQEELIKQFG